MTIVLLDSKTLYESCPAWSTLQAFGTVRAFDSSTLPEILERCASASVVLTRTTPLRREVMDYLARMHVVVNLSGDEQLVEEQIARDLGIEYLRVGANLGACAALESACTELANFLA